MNNKAIGIFDSGVGGLTVAAELIRTLPNENLIYFGDSSRFPYGTKSVSQLIEFTFEIIKYLQSQDVKLVVIACNSASAAALEKAQEHFSIPIIGVVKPGAKAAVLASSNRHIGVIGTQATINSGAYKKAIRLFDAKAKVCSVACPEFASFVENGSIDGEHVHITASRYLKPLAKQDIDALILGCTHYPLLGKVIQRVVGERVRLISSAQETAVEAKKILQRKNRLREEKNINHRFISTGDNSKFIELGSRFLGSDISSTETVKL